MNKQKNDYFVEMASTFKLLASPLKLRLINFISFCPRTVEDCAKKFDQSVQNISLHLIALSKANILEVSQVKNYRFYSLASNARVQVICKALLVDPQSLVPAGLTWDKPLELLIRDLKNHKVVLLDLRESEEANYLPVVEAHRFEGKLTGLVDYLHSFPSEKTLVLICKGRMCERLARATEIVDRAKMKVLALPLAAHELRDLNERLSS